MPGGHDYPGPPAALDQYRAVVDAASSDAAIKGAKNPYTSHNGHMFSFLTPEGTLALRLSDELGEEFQSLHESGPVMQYGSVMRGYVSVPEDLLAEPAGLAAWFDKARSWIDSLPPKPTKKG